MKKKLVPLLSLVLALFSFKANAATYNFNFYNNEKDEAPVGQIPSGPTPAITPPLASPQLPQESTVAQSPEHSAFLNGGIFSLGFSYYVKGGSNKRPPEDKGPNHYQSRNYKFRADKSDGILLNLVFGRPGSFKFIAEALKETQMIKFYHTNNHFFRTVNGHGVGLGFKKEFLYKSVLGFETGLGGRFIKGYEDKNKTNFIPADASSGGTHIKSNTISATAHIGLNFHFDKFSLGAQGFYSQNKLNLKSDTKTVNTSHQYAATGASLGLAYNF